VRRLWFASLCALAVLGALPGCSGDGRGAKPNPILSHTLPPQEALASIVLRFSRSGNPVERAALKPEIEHLIKFHPKDDAAKMAWILHAWLALERGDLAEAERDLARVENANPDEVGAHRDVGRALRGAILRRQKKPKEALALLKPLFAKLLDGYARTFLNEEAVLAALESHQIDDALHFMAAWLRQPDGPRDELKKKLALLLKGLKTEDLDTWLRHELDGRLANEGEQDDMLKLVIDRVAEAALVAKDVLRARSLLASGYALLGDRAEAIAKLALGSTIARVDSRAVGLLLSLEGDTGRERSIQLATGVAYGLGVPGGSVRLTTADDGGKLENTEDALSTLVRDGATVIVAGVSREHATRAALFARYEEVPVVLLRPPDPAVGESLWVFTLGEDPSLVAVDASKALAQRGHKSVGALVEKGYRTKAPSLAVVAACGDAEGFGKTRLDVIVLAAPPACARAFGKLAQTAVVPEGGDGGAYALEAGIFKRGSKPSTLAAWTKKKGTSPSWWAALGRDAAVLAESAVKALPEQSTEDADKVRALHESARAALAKAKATELWTTDAKGFEGSLKVARSFDLRKR